MAQRYKGDVMAETTSPSQWSFRNIATIVLVAILFVALGFGGYLIGAHAGGSSDDASSSSDRGEDSDAQSTGPYPQAIPPHPDEEARSFLLTLAHREDNYPLAYGQAEAPVVMSVFTDMSCPMCSMLEKETIPELTPFVDDGTLRIQYYFNPIFADQHHSDIGALGAIAAAQQGKLQEYLHVQAAQSGHIEWTEDVARDIAEQAGVSDMKKFASQMKSADTKTTLEEHAALAQQKLGLSGTPAIIINDRLVSGAQPIEVLRDTILAAKDDMESAE